MIKIFYQILSNISIQIQFWHSIALIVFRVIMLCKLYWLCILVFFFLRIVINSLNRMCRVINESWLWAILLGYVLINVRSHYYLWSLNVYTFFSIRIRNAKRWTITQKSFPMRLLFFRWEAIMFIPTNKNINTRAI